MCMLHLVYLHLISPISSLISPLFNILFNVTWFSHFHLSCLSCLFFYFLPFSSGFICFFHFFLEFCQFSSHLLLLFHHLSPISRISFLFSHFLEIIALLRFFFFEIHWGNIYVKIFIWSVMSFLDSSSVICFSCFLLLFSSSIFVKSLCCLILNYSSLEEVSFSWTSYWMTSCVSGARVMSQNNWNLCVYTCLAFISSQLVKKGDCAIFFVCLF